MNPERWPDVADWIVHSDDTEDLDLRLKSNCLALGILAQADGVRPPDECKVVRGPFGGEAELTWNGAVQLVKIVFTPDDSCQLTQYLQRKVVISIPFQAIDSQAIAAKLKEAVASDDHSTIMR